jgi:hypothetical protein
MKALKAICSASILALALSVPAFAGDLLSPGYVPPPPPPPPEARIVVEPNTVDTSVPTKTSSFLADMSTPGVVDMLWILASIF